MGKCVVWAFAMYSFRYDINFNFTLIQIILSIDIYRIFNIFFSANGYLLSCDLFKIFIKRYSNPFCKIKHVKTFVSFNLSDNVKKKMQHRKDEFLTKKGEKKRYL